MSIKAQKGSTVDLVKSYIQQFLQNDSEEIKELNLSKICPQAVHPSGKRLYEMADIIIDNCAPVAEGMMNIPGIESPYGAASGIACNILLWSINGCSPNQSAA